MYSKVGFINNHSLELNILL